MLGQIFRFNPLWDFYRYISKRTVWDDVIGRTNRTCNLGKTWLFCSNLNPTFNHQISIKRSVVVCCFHFQIVKFQKRFFRNVDQSRNFQDVEFFVRTANEDIDQKLSQTSNKINPFKTWYCNLKMDSPL